MFRNLSLLVICQALMMSSTSLVMTSSALAGLGIAPKQSLATLPLGISYFVVMTMLIPASLFMQRYGRKKGFLVGGLCGLMAGVIAGYALHTANFWLFCVSALFQGVAIASAQFYRFAAAEAVTDEFRNRAISWVLAGGIVAAFMGPGIARMTREALGMPPFSMSFFCNALLCLGVLMCIGAMRLPHVSRESFAEPARPLRKIAVLPAFITAVTCAMIAYAVMNLLMVSTPLAMQHTELEFDEIATVIQWHIVGMFAPSFFTGNLIDRFGVLRIMLVGVVMLFVCTLIALSGVAYPHFLISLVTLGIGWNFLYVGGTTLLTRVYRPGEKGMVQGVNDFLVFLGVAFTALSSGYFHHRYGWSGLNLLVIPILGLAGLLILNLMWRSSREISTVSAR